MIYIFDKTQAIIKVLTNDDFTAAHLNFKINTATTFEFSLPASKALPSGSKYVATPHPLDDSKFIMLRLTERVDNTETIDYSAYELAYQELATDGYIEDKRPQNQSALNLMKIALNGSNWELNNVNISGAATTNFYYVDRLSAISKVVDLLGGEIVFYIEIQGNAISGRYMDYLARQGADTSKVFASGSNLLTVERQSDSSNIYTAILPRGKGEEIDNGEADTPDGYGRRINIADVEWKKSAGKPLDKPKGSIVLSDPDATAEWGQINGNARLLIQTYDDIDDINVLINSAYKTLQSVNHPQIQYSATVADVGGLSLGDTVLIMHGDRDLSYKTRVFEVKYDLLSPDQTELSLGDNLSSNSITSQINNLNAVADTTSSQTQWTINQIGRPSTTFGNTEPANPKVGDVFFKELPDGGTKIYRWNGDIWELLASPTTADDIAAAVDDAVSQAKSHTATAIEQNNASQQEVMNDIAKSQADLAIKDGDFNNKAQAMADKALADAKTNTAQVAQETLNSANRNLADAKKSLTESIDKEVSDRASAVDAANSQAQTYANQAKADALNTIAKEVTDRQNAVSELNTKATNAVNQAKSDINDTINAISAGDRNYILDTANPKTQMSNGNDNQDLYDKANFYKSLDQWAKTDTQYKISFDWNLKTVLTNDMMLTLIINQAPWQNFTVTIPANKLSGHVDITFILWNSMISAKPTGITFRINSQMSSGNTITYYNLFMKSGTITTDWTPAPEDVVLDYTTKDNKIKETITQYQDTNDRHVSKLQTDVTTALGQVATKVSQTDYDKKTGDLATKYTQVKQTADSQAADIVDIKKTATSQASKINSISSDVDGTKQSISDIEKTQDSQSDKINQITSDVNGTKQSITDIQTKDGKQDTRMGTIETSVSGVKSDFSTYKTDANGRIGTAQTTAQTAVDGLKTKVSQTDYNTKTGQLQTDLTTTTQTANQAKTDIVSIQQKDGDQDEKMNTIVSDANGTKQTISDLKTAQDKQSGYISTLQKSAKGFEATTTKVDNLSVGGRNLLVGTNSNAKSWVNTGSGSYTEQYVAFDNGYKYNFTYTRASTNWAIYMFSGLQKDKFKPNTDYVLSFMANVSTDIKPGVLFANGASQHNFVKQVTSPTILSSNGDQKVVVQLRTDSSIPSESDQSLYMYGFDNKVGTFSIWDLKIESGNIATDWTPAPEDIDSATAKAQLTADNAALAISDYKTNADGRISKAQSDIKANATAITQKVSQTVYDQKTGDLTEAVSKAQSTADGAVSTVGNYKTSNDRRVEAAESTIEQHTNDITARVSKTDYDNNNSQLNTRFTKVEATANGVATTVSDLQQTVNSLGQTNLINNTEFSPDLQGWSMDGSGTYTTGDYGYSGAVLVLANTGGGIVNLYSSPISLNGSSSMTISWKLNYYIFSVGANGSSYIYLQYLDSNLNPIPNVFIYAQNVAGSSGKGWTNYIVNNFTLTNMPAGAKYIRLVVDAREKGSGIGINKPMLTLGTSVGAYVQGNYNNNAALAQVKITADNISSIVSDPTTGLSTRVQTAGGMLSTVKSTADGAMSKASQTNSDIKQEIQDRSNGDSNTLQQGKNFTTSQISNSETGMKSFVNQTISGLQIGVIKDDVSSLKDNINWQELAYDDVDYLKENGNYLITSGAGTNSPFKPWFYIKVDAPRTDRITQTVWKDLDNSLMHRRTYDGSSWTTWTQIVMSSTLLNIFHDSWSLGTTTNDGITKQMITGIMGQPDGTLILKGNSLILDGNTTVTGDFYAKGGNFTNLNASNITVGTLNGNQVNITNVNAANITGDITNFIQSNWNGIYGSTYITADGMSVSSGTVTTSFGSQGMRITMASNGGVVIQAATKSSGTQTGVLIGMNVGSTFTSFGFQSSSNYLYNDEMVILKTGSAAAGDYNIGGGVAFNHNVSFMDNIYMKYGKGFYGKWGDPQQAIFFQTINSGIPAIMHISGAGIAFGHKGDLYMLSHGGYQDFNNSSIKGSYTVDQPWITG
ncbi:phage tail spike protein [Leuconostoc mesenteroides]|uniref:phage tail spike protein n=1 Tax=Leuconostoc mesenteroides TaxID=1245 RepID=UPI000E09D577|nr:phage tail spike protein [Leuconostoc mesenteroides]RDG16227.1 hypothetical protein DQM12_00820 [Leuconostoc mesenteroides subsp. mesenteroides]